MSKESPKVTLLMGTYNRPDYLREAIQSVVNQTMKDWELILMNDGGVDVRDVVSQFDDRRIRYYHDPVNRGFAFRLNEGLKRAAGEYIAYLGDDDLFYPNHFEVLSKALDENPDIGAVYSDLYAVQFIKDETNGKRYRLNKFIQVSRDYNRDFMFHFNHTLHVSLMHRKDLALRVGGYDENVTVLIDWNITRKLTFFTDFKYVPAVTGEYYMPINKSDRISFLERQDPEKYKHNLRKIKANLPPEPWPKVHRIGVVIPIRNWTDESVGIVRDLLDNIDYPARFGIVNNAPSVTTEMCKQHLGNLAELRNVSLFTPKRSLSDIEAYRFGARQLNVDYVYLPSTLVKSQVKFRLINASPLLADLGNRAIRWDIPEEMKSAFDFLMKRSRFFKLSQPNTGTHNCEAVLIRPGVPQSFKWDYLYSQAMDHLKDGDLSAAYELLCKCETIKEGSPSEPYLVDLFAKVCFGLKYYDIAEEKCRMIIEQGYGADNWIRLGQIHQAKGKFEEAIEAYRKGLDGIDLKESDLESPVFPVLSPFDFNSYTAYLGLGECFGETGNLGESARMFRRAAKLKANSHQPFLGFGKIFLKGNELGKAEEALITAMKRNAKDPETYRFLGRLYQKKGQLDTAFHYYLKAFELNKTEAEDMDSLYTVGMALEKWGEMTKVFEEFLEHRPGHVPVMSRLSSIYCRLGEHQRAKGLVEQALVLDEKNPELKEIYFKIQQAENQRVAI